MNRVITGAFSLVLISISTFVTAGEIMTKESKDVLVVIEKMTSAFQKGDIDTVMSSYEPAATVLFEPGNPVSNAAQLRDMFTAMSAVNPVFTYSGHDVIINGDIAIHTAPWSMTGRGPDGADIAQSGLSVAVLRRQADGNWKMVIDNPHGAALMSPQK